LANPSSLKLSSKYDKKNDHKWYEIVDFKAKENSKCLTRKEHRVDDNSEKKIRIDLIEEHTDLKTSKRYKN
jgi:hypothetical protein